MTLITNSIRTTLIKVKLHIEMLAYNELVPIDMI